MAGQPAVLDREADSAAGQRGLSPRFEPSDRRAASRQAALRLARDARALPKDVRWFYLRTLRSAVRRDGLSGLDHTERPADLAKLLEIAGASRQVVVLGGRSALSAISLALDEERRQVTILDPLAEQWEREEYVRFVDTDVRSRIDFRPAPTARMPEASPAADVVFVDRAEEYREILAAAGDAERIVRPGGLAVLRGYRRHEVDELREHLRKAGSAVDGSVVDGAFVWRRPAKGGRLRSTGPTSKRGLPGFALTGMLVGMAAAVMLPASLSESLPGTSGNDRDLLPVLPSAPRGAGGIQTDARPQARSKAAEFNAPQPKARESGPSRSRESNRFRSRVRSHARLTLGEGAFSGTGNRNLGTLRVDRPVILRWTADERSLVIVSEEWRFRGAGRSGTTVLTPGTYRRFAVRSTASWKLELDAAQ